MMKPLLTAGDLRVIGSTTFEEFKHIEKDRALARRLQKIVDRRTVDRGNGTHPRRAPEPYEEHHRVTYTDAALEAAAKLAARHLRDYRLPDSAIDLIDEAGAVTRLTRHGRESVPDGVALAPLLVDVAEIEPIVARMARIPARQAIVFRSRASSYAGRVARARRVRPARGRPSCGAGHQTLARRARAARSPVRVLPVHRTDRRRQNRTGQTACAAARQRVHPLRYERVHGEACRRAAHRRPARATSASSKAGSSSTPCAHIPTASCFSTRSRKPMKTSSTSCCR